MIRAQDVNMALIQQAAEELEIGVPIRAWRVEDGQLVLSLATGGEARWGEREKEEGRKQKEEAARSSARTAPWRFDAALRAPDPRPIPGGDLSRLTKRQLHLVLADWGYQTETLNPRKAEFAEALTWLRESFAADEGG